MKLELPRSVLATCYITARRAMAVVFIISTENWEPASSTWKKERRYDL